MTVFRFENFEFDTANHQLHRMGRTVPLRPRTQAVLQYLIERPGQLVTKDDLMAALWSELHVTDAVLAVCISELRGALRDPARRPKLIGTVHRRGYRWLGPSASAAHGTSRPAHPAADAEDGLVGRETELSELRSSWERALTGHRQVVFLTGDPGMGKTTVVDAFLGTIERQRSPDAARNGNVTRRGTAVWVAHGRCMAQAGPREPFMPVLEGLGRLCRQPHGERLLAWLREHAPSWLLQLPGLIPMSEREALQHAYAGATRERMLREMAVGIEALTAETPLVLVLEDLHWSDPSTLEMIAALAQRHEPARLLVLGTYRTLDILLDVHPLTAHKHDLEGRRLCRELVLAPLSKAAVADYLSRRLPGVSVSAQLITALHHHTGGNPLFMVHATEQLIADGVGTGNVGAAALSANPTHFLCGLPHSLREMIEQRFHRLRKAERDLLEVAAVAGPEFTAAAVAAGVEHDAHAVEDACAALAHRGAFIVAAGRRELPEHLSTPTYRFSHPFYREVLYANLSAHRRRQLHRRIGVRLESAYAPRAPEIAGELAIHFERAGEHARAARYHRLAGDRAVQQCAYPEAIAHLTAALDALARLPDSTERIQPELDIVVALAPLLVNAKGSAAADVAHLYERARRLCERIGDQRQLFAVLSGIELFWRTHGNAEAAAVVARDVLDLAARSGESALLVEAYRVLGCNRFWAGELATARILLERAVTLYDEDPQPDAYRLTGHDPKIRCLAYLATLVWLMGYPDQAVRHAEEATTRAVKLAHPPSSALGYALTTWAHVLRRDTVRIEATARSANAVAQEYAFPFWEAIATTMVGWAAVNRGEWGEGMETLRRGYAAYDASGAGAATVDFHMLVADACHRCGRADDGLQTIADAFALLDRLQQRYFEAELHRLQGELVLLRAQPHAPGTAARRRRFVAAEDAHSTHGARAIAEVAEKHFVRALEVARRQGAKSLELRAAVSLAGLWHQQGQDTPARQLLAEVYGWFTEGFDTPDLRDARQLLAALEPGCVSTPEVLAAGY